jgi:hypothetical protein
MRKYCVMAFHGFPQLPQKMLEQYEGNHENPIRIAGLRSKIQTPDLLNIKEC